MFVTNRRVDLVAEGIDIALRIGEGGRTSYVGRTLTKYRHLVVAAPTLLKDVQIKEPNDLGPAPCVCWRTGTRPAWTLGDVEVSLEPLLVTNDYEHLLDLATQGIAVTEVPPFMAREAIEQGTLVEVLPGFPLPWSTVRLLVVETRAMSPLVREFLDFANQAFADALSSGSSAS